MEEERKLLREFLEWYDETIDYLPIEPSKLIDSFIEQK